VTQVRGRASDDLDLFTDATLPEPVRTAFPVG
jgi:hypothetical protein